MVAAFAPCCAPGGPDETPADARGEAEADVGGPDAPADGPGVLVLATDGAPNCNNALGSGCTCTTGTPFCDGTLGRIGCLDDDRVIATLGEILAAGIRTYVVGIPGAEDYVSVLDAMAVAGGTARDVSPRYYGVESRDELLSVLGMIAAGESSCVFELGHPPLDTTRINVLVDDDPLRRDDAENGFTYDATANTVTLTGIACDDLRAGRTSNVKFIFGCPPLL
ncbi:MAG: hypothetical protein QME96_12025 [Myxococcota bacterium]|nr:hypothetical protein [Myxococcota bacterium]